MAKNNSQYKTLEGNDMEGILPCPFCGEFDEEKQNYLHQTINKHGWYSIGCSGCGCEPTFCVRSLDDAIKKWNSRVTFSEELEFQAGIEYYKRYLIDLMS